MKSLISILIVIFPFFVSAQKADTVKRQKPDSVKKVKKDFLPTGVRVGMDLISLIRTQTDENFSGYEYTADIDFYRYFLTVEYGKWEKKFSTDEDRYSNDGNYMRVGVDVNFLKNDPDKNMFFFGGRYAWGSYSEVFSTSIVDPVWTDQTVTYTNTDVNSRWFEITTGLRVKMFKFFWMGYTARYKFGLKTNAPDGFTSYDVPGFGKTDENTTWGFNYQLLFRIPIRKKKELSLKDLTSH